MTALGVIYLPHYPPETSLDAARAADALGLKQLWLWEGCFLQRHGAAAAVLGRTDSGERAPDSARWRVHVACRSHPQSRARIAAARFCSLAAVRAGEFWKMVTKTPLLPLTTRMFPVLSPAAGALT